MYTQCPDCDTAFRVTAPDLQRATGRVVCIGCGREFNALERLTEDAPETPEAADDKRAILETLDELTGPHEIRIEDTGVEWRVIEEEESADDEHLQAEGSEALPDESGSVRWYIADIADLADGPDSEPEVAFDDVVADTTQPESGSKVTSPLPDESRRLSREDPGTSRLQESLELPPPPAVHEGDVQRYDDNTPLPDDFIDEREPKVPLRRAEDRIEPRSPEADEVQVDLGFGEPDDWIELLDEVGPPSGENVVESPVPESTGEVFAASGPSRNALADPAVRPAQEKELPIDDSYPSDIDTQFDLQAIELGIDLTGSRNLSLEDEAEVPDERVQLAAGEAAAHDPGDELTLEGSELELATDATPAREDTRHATAQSVSAGGPAAQAVAVNEWLRPGTDTAHRPAGREHSEESHREEAFEQEVAAAYSITQDDESGDSPDEPPKAGHFVPPATDEEMTINMLIDQDLIRLAEQQNVFTSTTKAHVRPDDAPHVETIIMEGEFVRNVLEAELLAEKPQDFGAPHSARERASGKPSVTGAARNKVAAPDDDDILLDAYTKGKDRMRGGRRSTDPPSYSVIAGVAGLSLVLAAQVVHAYRDTLATYAMFDRTVGSVYRLLGEPLLPVWNVREWKFESTSGSTDDTDEVLTISSRITNSSAKPLPYPLLHVSLTDRWEEIIGSKVLEPAEYLAGGADPAVYVTPGKGFTAVVRVEAPAPEATGFKLNVCYPEAGDRLRCATEDFKD